MMEFSKVFKYKVSLKGDLICTYVFTSESELKKWLQIKLPAFLLKHRNVTIDISELPALRVGDSCSVLGEGTDTFVIKNVHQVGDNSYMFALDSGWNESVSKCYLPIK